jgi:hypothetical protein
MGILEKIKEIEEEMARTQKNKATEYHLGLLKARLAKLRTQLLEPTGKSSGGGEGFETKRSGDARVVLIGFPRLIYLHHFFFFSFLRSLYFLLSFSHFFIIHIVSGNQLS